MYILYALLSAVFAALVAIFAKMGLSKIDSNTVTALRAIVMTIFTLGVVFFQTRFTHIGKVLEDKKMVLLIIFSGIAGSISWIFYFLALKQGNATQVVVIDKLSIIFVAIIAFILFNEEFSKLNIAGLILVTAGSIMVAIK